MTAYTTAPTYSPQLIAEYQGNPLIEALPPILPDVEVAKLMVTRPPFDDNERNLPTEIRWHLLGRLKKMVVPRPKFFELEKTVSRLIRNGYVLRDPGRANTWRTVYNAQSPDFVLHPGQHLASGDSEALLVGLSGIGKTTAVNTVLRSYSQQVIDHVRWQGQPLAIRQIVWIKVVCPENGTIRSFCREFARQLDQALRTDKYYKMYTKPKVTIDDVKGYMRQHAASFFLGLLVVDEIQRLKAVKQGDGVALMNFIQDLRDLMGVPILLVGTYKAMGLFSREMKDARRASENGLIDFKRSVLRDDEWDAFVKRLWKYQWTKVPTKMTEDILVALHHLSLGITDVVVVLFKLAQQYAMESGIEEITVEVIKHAYNEYLIPLHRPLNALRTGTFESLASFEDLIPPDLWDLNVHASATISVSELNRALDAAFEDQSKPAQGTSTPAAAAAAANVSKRRRSKGESGTLKCSADAEDTYDALQKAGVIPTGNVDFSVG